MSGRRFVVSRGWILALTALAVSNWLAAAPTDELDKCASGPEHVGMKQLSAACPQVESTLQFLGLDQLLFGDWRERLSSRDLNDLAFLEQRYDPSQRRASPAIAALAPILQSLQQQQKSVAKSWWDAARDWFRNWLRYSNSALAKWLNEWLEKLNVSDHALDGVIYCLMGLIVIAAVVVVVREIRLGARARRDSGRGANASGPELPAIRMANRPAPLHGVRELLRVLVERLLATGRLACFRSPPLGA